MNTTTQVELRAGSRVLERYPTGALGAFALALFDGGVADLASVAVSKRFDASVADVLATLDALGVSDALVEWSAATLRALASLRREGHAPLKRPEAAWAGVDDGPLLSYTLRRSARGCRVKFEWLDLAGLRDLIPNAQQPFETQAEQALRLIALRSGLAFLPGDAVVVFDLTALDEQEDAAFFQELWDERPPRAALEASVDALRRGMVDALCALSPVDAEAYHDRRGLGADVAQAAAESWSGGGGDAWQARLRRWPAAWRARDLEAIERFERDPADVDAGLSLLEGASDHVEMALAREVVSRMLIAQPSLESDPEHWSRLLEWSLETPERSAQAPLDLLLWRDPDEVVVILPRIAADEARRMLLAEALVSSLQMTRGAAWETRSWRVDVVELAERLVAQDEVEVALALTRQASDVDDPDEALIEALRSTLRSVYGQPFEEGRADASGFLLTTRQGDAVNDRRDLARILHDALVGAVIEPSMSDAGRREALFEQRVAPGLSYLSGLPGEARGRSRGKQKERDDESGLGLVGVSVFLLGLIAAIVLVGVLLSRCNPM